jgi:hypothetical protein
MYIFRQKIIIISLLYFRNATFPAKNGAYNIDPVETATRVVRFFLVKHTKTWKIIPNREKYTKWPLNIPTHSIARPSRIDQNWDFWFEIYHLATLTATCQENPSKPKKWSEKLVGTCQCYSHATSPQKPLRKESK